MPLILPGNVASATAATTFSVANSCRFNRGDSPDLQKTWSGTPTNQKKYTFSFWVKRCGTGTIDFIMDTAGDFSDFKFTATDEFEWEEYTSGYKYRLKTNRKFRDPSAWYHFCCRYDSTDGTAGDRVRLYVNGVEETSFAVDTNVTLNHDSIVNSAILHSIASQQGEGHANYANHYLSEVVFIDGSSLAPTSFGEFDEDSPTIWKPIDVSGLTFGTLGFYLDFEDSGDLGDDESGNTNDWTEANLAAADQATDTPTNNFCTMNPLENHLQESTFSEGNNTVLTVSGSSKYAPNLSTIGVTAGKWYWEVKPTTGSTDYMIGVSSTQTTAAAYELGHNANDYGYAGASGIVRSGDANVSYGNTYTTNDIMGVALDLTNNKLYWAKNGTWQDSGDPTSGATGTGAISITAVGSTGLGAYFPAVTYWTSTTGTFAFNFGGCPAFAITSGNADADGYGNFEYAPPSGYYALCTKNLAEYG